MADQSQIENLELEIARQKRHIDELEKLVNRLVDDQRRIPAMIADQIRRRG